MLCSQDCVYNHVVAEQITCVLSLHAVQLNLDKLSQAAGSCETAQHSLLNRFFSH
jgi:hypothetical protein